MDLNRIVGLDDDGGSGNWAAGPRGGGKHLSRAGYSAEDGLAYAGEYSFGGGDAGTDCTSATVATTPGVIGACGPNRGIFPEIATGAVLLDAAVDGTAGAERKLISTGSWRTAGYNPGDKILVQPKIKADGTDEACEIKTGLLTIKSISDDGLTVVISEASDAGLPDSGYSADLCTVSRPGGYRSGVTLTAADRDIASVGSSVASGCAGESDATDQNSRCYPDTSIEWDAYDPYTDMYYASALGEDGYTAAATGAGAHDAYVGTPMPPTISTNGVATPVIAAAAGSGGFYIGKYTAGYAAGDKILVTKTAAACTVDGLYTVKTASTCTTTPCVTNDAKLLVEEVVSACDATCAAACRISSAQVGPIDARGQLHASATGWGHAAGQGASGQVRGFKGLGPAQTEPTDEYACTIHTRECSYAAAGFCYKLADKTKDTTYTTKATCEAVAERAWGYWTDSEDQACEKANVGSFQIRLNSSPGQKTVRRQYVGEATDRKSVV